MSLEGRFVNFSKFNPSCSVPTTEAYYQADERNLNSSVTSLIFTVYDYLTSACHPCHQSVFEFWLVGNKLHNNRLHKVEVLLPKGREVEEMKELEGIEKAKELQEEGMSKGRGGGRKA